MWFHENDLGLYVIIQFVDLFGSLNAKCAPAVYVAGENSAVVHNVEQYEALIVYGTIGGYGTSIFGIMLNDGNVELNNICGTSAEATITATYDKDSKDLSLSYRYSSSFRVLYYRQI